MTETEKREAARQFINRWQSKKGYEKGETQKYWIDLLSVVGVTDPTSYIDFEKQVININNADGDYGYAHVTWYSVVLSRLTRTCNRCGYDPLWKPNDDDSKCIRHTYNSWRYDEVFIWSPRNNELSLEEAFDVWLKSQPTSIYEPVKKMSFGQIGWK